MSKMDFRKAAEELYTSCEFVSKDVAITFIASYLKEVHRRGIEDHYNMLADNMYPKFDLLE